MTREREIAAADWPTFGPRFSDAHHGWLTEAIRREPSGAEHRLWDDAALEKVELGGDGGGFGVLIVTAVTPDARHGPGARLRAVADAPARVTVIETDDGRHAGFRVEDEAGGETEIRFRVSAQPELVDGVLDEEG